MKHEYSNAYRPFVYSRFVRRGFLLRATNEVPCSLWFASHSTLAKTYGQSMSLRGAVCATMQPLVCFAQYTRKDIRSEYVAARSGLCNNAASGLLRTVHSQRHTVRVCRCEERFVQRCSPWFASHSTLAKTYGQSMSLRGAVCATMQPLVCFAQYARQDIRSEYVAARSGLCNDAALRLLRTVRSQRHTVRVCRCEERFVQRCSPQIASHSTLAMTCCFQARNVRSR